MKATLLKALSWAVFPALLVGGFAIAAPGSGSGDESGGGDTGAGNQTFALPAPPPGLPKGAKRHGAVVAGTAAGPAGAPPPPPAGGISFMGGDLTYSEVHVMQDGQPVVLRDDRGTIASVSSDSITVTENDGNDVTIPVDSNTKVVIPPDHPTSSMPSTTLDDLETGQEVTVHRQEGGPADFIGVIPAAADGRFVPLPPPPGPVPDGPRAPTDRTPMSAR